jgi:hypothetical protein
MSGSGPHCNLEVSASVPESACELEIRGSKGSVRYAIAPMASNAIDYDVCRSLEGPETHSCHRERGRIGFASYGSSLEDIRREIGDDASYAWTLTCGGTTVAKDEPVAACTSYVEA